MTANERLGVSIVAALSGALAATLATGAAETLNHRGWFGAGANEIQWVSGILMFVGISSATLTYLARTCAASWRCLRPGQHPVDGCLKKVCDRHHTLPIHRAVHDRHGPAHTASGRLPRGQSHRPPA